MCEFCTKHGEGKKWYLNVKNYSNDLLSDIKRREYIKDFFYWVDRTYSRYFNILRILPFSFPVVGPALRAVVKHKFLYEHWGQVLPIEDVEKVLSMTNSITRVPCVCRKTITGKEIRNCFLISLDPRTIGIEKIIDRSFFGGPDVNNFEKMDKADAITFMKNQEKKGMCHSIWTLNAPFIGAVCNCDNTGCIAMKLNKIKAPITFKAEYIAMVDNNKCVGCKMCINICPFGALGWDSMSKKIIVANKICYGCGICRVACKKDAITIKDRASISDVANLW